MSARNVCIGLGPEMLVETTGTFPLQAELRIEVFHALNIREENVRGRVDWLLRFGPRYSPAELETLAEVSRPGQPGNTAVAGNHGPESGDICQVGGQGNVKLQAAALHPGGHADTRELSRG